MSPSCMIALSPWKVEGFLTSGVSLGEVVSHKSITTDASLSGWGATREGRAAQGLSPRYKGASHQLFGVDGNATGARALRAPDFKLSRPGQDRQYDGHVLRQQTRGPVFIATGSSGSRTNDLVRVTHLVDQDHTRPWSPQQRCRSPVRGGPRYEVWTPHLRVASQKFRKFGHGPVRVSGEYGVSVFLRSGG